MLLIKSKSGQIAFKERSALFSSRQRAAFILFDGRAAVADILLAMAPMGLSPFDVDVMRDHGFLEPAIDPASQAGDASLMAVSGGPVRLDQDRYLKSKPLATQVTAKLGLKGFRLNLAVESAANIQDLVALLPKIQAIAGLEACAELERALKG